MLRHLLALGGAAALGACGRRKPQATTVSAGATVLALGDSLTYGTGATPDTSYPAVLAGLSGWQVVNAGVPGDTSAQALQRLPALLQEHKPALVLVSIGGNDLLRRLPEADTRANLQRICEQALAAGAQVMVLAVPRPSVATAFTGSLSDHPLYAEVSGGPEVAAARTRLVERAGRRSAARRRDPRQRTRLRADGAQRVRRGAGPRAWRRRVDGRCAAACLTSLPGRRRPPWPPRRPARR